ncbi:metallophosphoesterase family protein [Azospirillum sp. YIM B02556]|uniref:Metallophosphoesterase family protein n=1 Tax=Azospirillum endophyticum TaxID=2800326 RepID=A0ABS1F0Z7_9PROT|nr:metallophosphoesterase family protein [Azospirillum endophyticum]MBK1837085.1 metallophosphoesterase family protein [Azospirillum endophyticum]
MKIALVSDIHANLEALQATLDAIRAEGAERIVCLGDIVGYNTDAAACIALLRQAGAVCIAGNHDRAVTGIIGTEGFSGPAARAVAWTKARLDEDSRAFLSTLPLTAVIDGALLAVHGALHPETGKELVRLDDDGKRGLSLQALAGHSSGARICAFGHTHRAGLWEWRDGAVQALPLDGGAELRPDGLYLLNPGTVGEPRGADSRACFACFDSASRLVTLHRVAYARRAALSKTRRAGLAPRFAAVPAPLRLQLIGILRVLGIYEWIKRALPRRISSI